MIGKSGFIGEQKSSEIKRTSIDEKTKFYLLGCI